MAYIFHAKKSLVKEVTDKRNITHFKRIFDLFNNDFIVSDFRMWNEGTVCDNDLERTWNVPIVAEF